MLAQSAALLALSCIRTTAFVMPRSSASVDVVCRNTYYHVSALNSSTMGTSETIPSSMPSSETLSKLTVPQLKDLLRQQGLKVGGNKPDLIERLLLTSSNVDIVVAQLEREKEETIADMERMLKKKRASLTLTEGIPSPGLKRQVAMAIENAEVKAKEEFIYNKTNQLESTTSDSSNGSANFHEIDGLPSMLVQRLEAMGITTPTPIQREAIPLALNGVDLMGVAQTGTGKFCSKLYLHLHIPR